MVEVIGKIGDLTAKGVEVVKFRYQELVEFLNESTLKWELAPPPPERILSSFLGPKLTLKFAPETIDSLVEQAGSFCRITVEDGVVVGIVPFKKEHEVLREVKGLLEPEETGQVDLEVFQQPKSLRNKTIAILDIISEMQAGSGMAERGRVVEEAKKRYEIREEEAAKVIDLMLREGTIYEPQKGFLKKPCV